MRGWLICLALAAGSCGQPCSIAGQSLNNGQCTCRSLQPVKADGTCPCSQDIECGADSHCEPDDGANFSCYHINQSIGSPCASAVDCETRFCNHRLCSGPIPDGEGDCQQSSDCMSGICGWYTHLCGMQPNGGTCSADEDCVSHNCPSIAGLGTCSDGSTGQLCTEDEDCVSGNCIFPYFSGEGMPPSHGDCGPHPAGGYCATGTDCTSGTCVNQQCK